MPSFLYQTTNTEDAFEAYRLYAALRNHFTTKSYDYFKYDGRVRTAKSSFLKRPDQFWFHKLAQRKDRFEFLLANFVYGDENWIGNILQNEESERNLRDYIKVRDSLSYTFKNDLNRFDDTFDKTLEVVDGQHPMLLKLLLRKQIAIETFCILEEMCQFSRKWNRKIVDPVVWPKVHFKVLKYKPFISFDKEKLKKIVVDTFSRVS